MESVDDQDLSSTPKHDPRSHMKIEMSEQDVHPPLPSPFSQASGTLRKVRRLLRGSARKQLSILLLFLFIIIITIRSSRLSTYSPWAAPNLLSCSSARTNPYGIAPPPAPDQSRMRQTWTLLKTHFDNHAPKPSTLPRESFHNDGNFPSLEQIKGHLNISEADAHATRVEHAEVIRHLPPFPLDLYSGRGVIMLAGGHYSEFAATALGMLREVGSKLPVEVWVKDASEEEPGWCVELAKEGMACRRLDDYLDMSVFTHPYQWKIFTMLFSSFNEFLFLDADNMPMKNPDTIFDSKAYRDTGAILWPDYWKFSGSPYYPYIAGLTDEPSDALYEDKTVESGQVVWNKERHWKSFCLAIYYNYFGPKYYYTLISQGWAGWGDKDTFLFGLKALKEPFHFIPHSIITMFVNGTVHGIGMVQADPANSTKAEPLFLHANIVKWSVRDFLCVGCSGNPSLVSAIENPHSSINSHLREGKRIFASGQLGEMGLDPEPSLWKCMEHDACRSVWGNEQLCASTRQHMRKTFGYQFKESKLATVTGYGDKVCLVEP